jgi:methionyl aminopeptidase
LEPEDALMKAGGIASRIRNEVSSRVKAGTPIIEICDFVEGTMREMGGVPAFPCNVDVNQVAAHYTSPVEDRSTIPEGSLVKVDIGVHVDGYIADTATTVCLDPRLEGMVEAAEAGLSAAVSMVRAGVVSTDIGGAIERAIKARGYSPIRNLTGHRMARYVVHAGQSIPNIPEGRGHVLREGEVYAIEPFSVPPDAAGLVVDGAPSNIYLFRKKRKIRSDAAKRMLKFVQAEYRTMPFASRWVLGRFPGTEGVDAFAELQRTKCVYSYPQLVERSRALVAQAEHTVIVTEKGCVVTTA